MSLSNLRRDIETYERRLEREQELLVALTATDWKATATIVVNGQSRTFLTPLPTTGMVARVQAELTNVQAQIAAFEAAHGIVP